MDPDSERSGLSKLAKILALTDSDQEGEALSALRQARQILFTQGLSMADLANVLAQPAPASKNRRPAIDITRGLIKAYEARIQRLEAQNSSLQKELMQAESAITRWRMVAESISRDCTKQQAAAEKWRDLARHTAEHLWELGQQLRTIDGPETDPSGEEATILPFPKPNN